MPEASYYADRLYSMAIICPDVDATSEHEIARYIRREAGRLCLDWRAVLREAGDLQPYVLDFKQASETNPEDYSESLK